MDMGTRPNNDLADAQKRWDELLLTQYQQRQWDDSTYDRWRNVFHPDHNSDIHNSRENGHERVPGKRTSKSQRGQGKPKAEEINPTGCTGFPVSADANV